MACLYGVRFGSLVCCVVRGERGGGGYCVVWCVGLDVSNVYAFWHRPFFLKKEKEKRKKRNRERKGEEGGGGGAREQNETCESPILLSCWGN